MKFLSFSFFALCLLVSTHAMAAYDKPYVGDEQIYETKAEDTLVHIARDYNLGFVEMRAANPHVDPWLPGEGAALVLPTRHILPKSMREGVVINLPEMRLYVFKGNEPPTTFPIGVGREGLGTPQGKTSVVRKMTKPQWRPTPRMRAEDPNLPAVVEPGPDNPLGTHALYLGWPQYAIHGTNRPFGIGRRVSSGCIRLYPEGIKELYKMVPTGTEVQVVNQPIKAAWIDNKLYLEAHPDLEQAIKMEEIGAVVSHKLREDDLKLIIREAGEYEGKVDWSLVRTAIRERRGSPLVIATRPAVEGEEEEKTAAYQNKKKQSFNQ
jgi:L,D-transpeptidase ErfK/SrfK